MAVSQLQKLCAFGISGTFAAALTATSALTATPTWSSAPDLPASQSSAGVTVTQAHIDKGRLVVIGTSRFGTRCEDGQFEARTDCPPAVPDDAAMKLLYLILNHQGGDWKNTPRE